MSYIEEKYTKLIFETLDNLSFIESEIKALLEEKSISIVDEIAQLCAKCNKQINLILKKYYPEIVSLSSKLKIKSQMKFFYDLIDKLTDFIRNIDEFKKLDDKYFDSLIEFMSNKNDLIEDKYTKIATNELTAFYDKQSRANLEKILEQKLARRNREYFTLGSLEEEIKKIGQIAGANRVNIISSKRMKLQDLKLIENPNSLIQYSILSNNEEILKRIGFELKEFLISKGFEAMILLVEIVDIDTKHEGLMGNIITSAKLLPDF